MSSNSQQTAFINATPLRGRLISEQATSAPAKPTQDPKPVELRTDTSSTIAIGLDDQINPTVLNIEIEFRCSLKQPESEKVVVEYEAKHEMQFQLIAWTGITDWTNLPEETFAPYSAILHDLAVRKAEITLHEMGIRGAVLPRPSSFAHKSQAASIEPAPEQAKPD